MEPVGIVTNIQRFSIHDGPGIRTTVFLKGCPLRCLWCHNPETYEKEPKLCYKREKCIGCGQCMEECRQQALGKGEEGLRYDTGKCIKCFRCVENCPSKALFVCGQTKTVQEVVDEVLADRDLYKESGGGVTFSGGEPTVQNSFLIALIHHLKKEKIHLALDTCGQCMPEIFREVVRDVDLCLFDLKHSDSERHRELTGAGNEMILDNLAYLNSIGKKIHIRIPVIPGKNDTDSNYKKTADILKEMKSVEELVLLGYHPLGLSKIVEFDNRQKKFPIEQPSGERMQEIKQYFDWRLPLVKVTYR